MQPAPLPQPPLLVKTLELTALAASQLPQGRKLQPPLLVVNYRRSYSLVPVSLTRLPLVLLLPLRFGRLAALALRRPVRSSFSCVSVGAWTRFAFDTYSP